MARATCYTTWLLLSCLWALSWGQPDQSWPDCVYETYEDILSTDPFCVCAQNSASYCSFFDPGAQCVKGRCQQTCTKNEFNDECFCNLAQDNAWCAPGGRRVCLSGSCSPVCEFTLFEAMYPMYWENEDTPSYPEIAELYYDHPCDTSNPSSICNDATRACNPGKCADLSEPSECSCSRPWLDPPTTPQNCMVQGVNGQCGYWNCDPSVPLCVPGSFPFGGCSCVQSSRQNTASGWCSPAGRYRCDHYDSCAPYGNNGCEEEQDGAYCIIPEHPDTDIGVCINGQCVIPCTRDLSFQLVNCVCLRGPLASYTDGAWCGDANSFCNIKGDCINMLTEPYGEVSNARPFPCVEMSTSGNFPFPEDGTNSRGSFCWRGALNNPEPFSEVIYSGAQCTKTEWIYGSTGVCRPTNCNHWWKDNGVSEVPVSLVCGDPADPLDDRTCIYGGCYRLCSANDMESWEGRSCICVGEETHNKICSDDGNRCSGFVCGSNACTIGGSNQATCTCTNAADYALCLSGLCYEGVCKTSCVEESFISGCICTADNYGAVCSLHSTTPRQCIGVDACVPWCRVGAYVTDCQCLEDTNTGATCDPLFARKCRDDASCLSTCELTPSVFDAQCSCADAARGAVCKEDKRHHRCDEGECRWVCGHKILLDGTFAPDCTCYGVADGTVCGNSNGDGKDKCFDEQCWHICQLDEWTEECTCKDAQDSAWANHDGSLICLNQQAIEVCTDDNFDDCSCVSAADDKLCHVSDGTFVCLQEKCVGICQPPPEKTQNCVCHQAADFAVCDNVGGSICMLEVCTPVCIVDHSISASCTCKNAADGAVCNNDVGRCEAVAAVQTCVSTCVVSSVRAGCSCTFSELYSECQTGGRSGTCLTNPGGGKVCTARCVTGSLVAGCSCTNAADGTTCATNSRCEAGVCTNMCTNRDFPPTEAFTDCSCTYSTDGRVCASENKKCLTGSCQEMCDPRAFLRSCACGVSASGTVCNELGHLCENSICQPPCGVDLFHDGCSCTYAPSGAFCSGTGSRCFPSLQVKCQPTCSSTSAVSTPNCKCEFAEDNTLCRVVSSTRLSRCEGSVCTDVCAIGSVWWSGTCTCTYATDGAVCSNTNGQVDRRCVQGECKPICVENTFELSDCVCDFAVDGAYCSTNGDQRCVGGLCLPNCVAGEYIKDCSCSFIDDLTTMAQCAYGGASLCHADKQCHRVCKGTSVPSACECAYSQDQSACSVEPDSVCLGGTCKVKCVTTSFYEDCACDYSLDASLCSAVNEHHQCITGKCHQVCYGTSYKPDCVCALALDGVPCDAQLTSTCVSALCVKTCTTGEYVAQCRCNSAREGSLCAARNALGYSTFTCQRTTFDGQAIMQCKPVAPRTSTPTVSFSKSKNIRSTQKPTQAPSPQTSIDLQAQLQLCKLDISYLLTIAANDQAKLLKTLSDAFVADFSDTLSVSAYVQGFKSFSCAKVKRRDDSEDPGVQFDIIVRFPVDLPEGETPALPDVFQSEQTIAPAVIINALVSAGIPASIANNVTATLLPSTTFGFTPDTSAWPTTAPITAAPSKTPAPVPRVTIDSSIKLTGNALSPVLVVVILGCALISLL